MSCLWVKSCVRRKHNRNQAHFKIVFSAVAAATNVSRVVASVSRYMRQLAEWILLLYEPQKHTARPQRAGFILLNAFKWFSSEWIPSSSSSSWSRKAWADWRRRRAAVVGVDPAWCPLLGPTHTTVCVLMRSIHSAYEHAHSCDIFRVWTLTLVHMLV